ncbi:cysteine desulfurase / selenocysteine lyase [Candidatus Nanopelagicus hibericus]|uniref:Cysteine desulfurase n=1 Tax=Candidatus Nanopelagicus hibericus TaxID=1884915 RepID=A0A249K9B1_9ACTN|nr:cysteine desulfurase [Candidatus Nanopelagicus hibericus]ASY13380.1 cysteine desulfurase / selenocysteine lyase [Candidatus Nanopelagicus hibericus]
MSLDFSRHKNDFPILKRKVRGGNTLIYLDSGATSQKPEIVIEAEANFYRTKNAAVHRGAHLVAEEASEVYEGARENIARFIGAKSDEVIFTKSATESLNLIAYSLGNPESKFHLKSGDEIVVSEMEHHANLIPWQQLAKRVGAKLTWFKITDEGRLDLSDIDKLINKKTKIVAITHQSNVLGTIVPLALITKAAHAVGAVVVLDACQSAPHFAVDVQKLEVDFLAFSGHKVLGPTGIGVLWGKVELLDQLEPSLFGGSMVDSVTMQGATWAKAPRKFEAGVPNMAQAVGLSAAIDYISEIGMDKVAQHEQDLTKQLISGLQNISGVQVVGPVDMKDRGGVVSFTVDGVHPHDVGQYLDQFGIAVRTGHHCAWPLMRRLNLVGTTRASFHLYNDENEVKVLLDTVSKIKDYFKVSK